MEFIENTQKLILKLDKYGKPINLTIKESEKTNTIIGGILSLSMICFLSSLLIIGFFEIIYSLNPIVTLEKQVVGEDNKININKHSFPLAIALTDFTNIDFYKPRYFSYKLGIKNGSGTSGVYVEKSLNFTKCKKENFSQVSNKTFNNLLLENKLCLNEENLSVFGSWSSDSVTFISLKIILCDNRTSTQTCASMEEIEYFLRNDTYYWNIYFMNTNINPQIYAEPMTYQVVNYFKLIKPRSYKESIIYITPQSLKSDDGFIFKKYNTYSSLAYDFYDNDEGIDLDSKVLVNFILMCSPNNYIFHRYYTKIHTKLASLGGLSNVINYFFIFLTYKLSILKRDEKILNSIFDYDFNYSNSNAPKKNVKIDINDIFGNSETKTKSKKYCSFTNSPWSSKPVVSENCIKLEKQNILEPCHNHSSLRSQIKSFKLNKSNIFQSPKKIIDIINKRKANRIKFNFIEIIKAFYLYSCLNMRLKNKMMLYNKSLYAIRNYLDITYLIKKFEEFEQLKLVLLNEDQVSLFNFISKELMSLDQAEIHKNRITNTRQDLSDKEKMVAKILTMKANFFGHRETTEIDRKLFSFLDNVFKD
jgi:hypothetical protein